MNALQETAFSVLQGQFFLQQAEAGVQFHTDLRKWSHQCPNLALQRVAWPQAAASCSFPDLLPWHRIPEGSERKPFAVTLPMAERKKTLAPMGLLEKEEKIRFGFD